MLGVLAASIVLIGATGLSFLVGSVDVVVRMPTQTIRAGVTVPWSSVFEVLHSSEAGQALPVSRDITARGFVSGTRARSKVAFDYQILLTPLTVPVFVQPTVPAGTRVILCDWMKVDTAAPCPPGSPSFHTLRAAILDRECSTGFFLLGRCTGYVPIVADDPGSAGNVEFVQGRTSLKVHLPGGAATQLYVETGYISSGGSDAHAVVTEQDRDAARQEAARTLLEDLARRNHLAGAAPAVLVAISESRRANADHSETVRYTGWAIPRSVFRSIAMHALQELVPPGQRLLVDTIGIETLATKDPNVYGSPRLTVTAEVGPADKAEIARLIAGVSTDRAPNRLARLGIEMISVRRRLFPWPVFPKDPHQIHVVFLS